MSKVTITSAGRWLGLGAGLMALALLLPTAVEAQIRYGFSVRFEEPELPYKRDMNRWYRPRLNPLVEEIRQRQANGENLTCSVQIYREAHWLVNYTTRGAEVERRIGDLKKSLADDRDQSWAAQQDESDGSWGACYESWFFRLHASVDPLKELQVKGEKPRYRLKFLEQVDTVEELEALYDEMIISRLDVDGTSHRRDLNLVTTALGQMLWLPELAEVLDEDYPREKMAQALIRIVDDKWQNQETGYWGAWYEQGGRINKTDDLSITFHIVSYRKGDVKRLEQIARTTLNLRETKYPFGWHDRGTTNNHHSYDVAKLLRFSWPYLNDYQRLAVSAEISIMLARSLRLTMDGQSRFFTDAYDNIGDAYYFGVSFLDEVGYFRRSKRFWARDMRFPKAEIIRLRLLANLEALNSQDPMVQAALRKVRATD